MNTSNLENHIQPMETKVMTQIQCCKFPTDVIWETGEDINLPANKDYTPTVKNLKASAKFLGIKGYSKMNKKQLITAILSYED